MRRPLIILLTVCLIMSAVTAWAYWTAGSATGGNGAAAVSSVNQGATPTASAVGDAVTVAWAPTTLTTGQAVTGYTVRRYSGSTAQTILTACTGTITGTNCVENNVPTGVWTYSVTPLFATNWVGVESAQSNSVVVCTSLGIFTACQDIGAPPIAGSSAYSAGTYTMSGSGADIWNPPDQFQFAYRTMTGDGRLTARVVADTAAPTPNGAAKAGVMIRNSLTTGSVHAMMNLTASNGTEFISRSVDQGRWPDAVYAASTPSLNNPYWVRITRVGNTLMGEYSANGTTWIQQGTTQTITMESTTYVGLVVMSHDIAASYSATFDNVALTTPPITPDSTGPTGGSVDASGLVGTGSRYAASTTLSLVLAKGIDPSGVATTGSLLNRATATLASGGTADGTCGTFGSYTQVGGAEPPSATSDTVSDQACYSYQYVVKDVPGNSTTYTSPAIKVDLTPPTTPSLVFSGFTNTYWPSSGTTVFYRSATSGSFVATAAATDAGSGIGGYSFPALGTNWTSTPGALGINTYSWSGAPAAPGATSITATNNANGVSSTSFTPTADDTAPSAGSVTPPDTTQASTSVSVAFTTGTDGGSGLGTRLLQRQSATLTGTTCGSYGGWTTAATNPASSPFSDTVAGGFCYQYQYVVADNVGNTNTATSGNVVPVTVASSTVKAQYRNNEATLTNDTSIQPHLQLVNTSASGVDLSTITVRYWFTKEAGASTFATPCYWATVGNTNVTTSVVAVPPRTGADSYLLVGFQPSTLAAGASSEIQLGLNKTDNSVFNEADDYSYGTGTTFTDSTKVTVYQGGTLIWGTEP